MAKIFVAAADETLRGLLQATFSRDGHEITTGSDGNEAFRALRENEFDLAILDYAMPEKQAHEVLAALAEEDISIPPAIILSTKGTHDRIQECVEVGAKDFVLKPFQIPDLLLRAHRLLNKKKK